MRFQRMTEEEIKRDVRLSANPENQVRILAQLNAVTPKIIRRVVDGQTWEDATARRYPKPKYIPKQIYKPYTSLEVCRLKELYKSGMKHKDIGAELGREKNSISSKICYLRKKGEII